MNPSLAFIIGSGVTLIAWAIHTCIRLDNNAVDQARREDAAYMRGYHRGMTGKAPQLHQYDV